MTKYGFRDNAIIVQGNLLSGFGEGDDVFQGRFLNDQFSSKVGADGKMIVRQSADARGEFIIKAEQGSQISQVLGELFDAQVNEFQAIDIMCKNTISGEFVQGRGFFTKGADYVRGANDNDEEWRLEVEDFQAFRAILTEL